MIYFFILAKITCYCNIKNKNLSCFFYSNIPIKARKRVL